MIYRSLFSWNRVLSIAQHQLWFYSWLWDEIEVGWCWSTYYSLLGSTCYKLVHWCCPASHFMLISLVILSVGDWIQLRMVRKGLNACTDGMNFYLNAWTILFIIFTYLVSNLGTKYCSVWTEKWIFMFYSKSGLSGSIHPVFV